MLLGIPAPSIITIIIPNMVIRSSEQARSSLIALGLSSAYKCEEAEEAEDGDEEGYCGTKETIFNATD